MAVQERLADTYSQYLALMAKLGGSEFFDFFENAVRSSPMDIKFYERYMERRIDNRWLEAIEAAIIPLDNIIRNPRRFIKREEDIVPIELAHDIGPESVRHLAQHTNMIEAIDDGNVIPGRILNVTKEESFDTYENRFVYTLLRQIQYFLDKRMAVVMQGTKNDDRFEYSIDGSCEVGHEKVKYHLGMEFTTPHVEVEETAFKLLTADVSGMTALERVERLRKILYAFQSSQFCKNMANSVPVRPPLVMTNVLRKNPDFIECVKLWGFINSYNELGYSVEYVERFRNPSRDDIREMISIVMLQYMMIKSQSGRIDDSVDYTERRTEIAPNIIHRYFEEIASSFDLTVDEVRRVFEKEIRRDERRKEAIQSSIRSIFDRAIAVERKKLDAVLWADRVRRTDRYIDACRAAVAELNAIREEKRRREEEAARLKAEAEAKKRAEINARRRAKYAEKRRAELEAKQAAEEAARLEAERKAREEEERVRAELAARLKAEAEAREKAEREAEEARLKAEAEAREAEERRLAEEAVRAKAEAEAREKAEREAREAAEKAEREAKEAEERRLAEEAARAEAEEKIRKNEEAAKAAEAARLAAADEVRNTRKKYSGMSRKKKKSAQKRDGVYGKIGKKSGSGKPSGSNPSGKTGGSNGGERR